jgi:hypothetical protein
MTALECILLLLAITITLVVTGRLLYLRTQRVEVVVLLVVIYFWTFAGAWFFIADCLSNFNGFHYGLSYYYLMEKMFPFRLDVDYLLSLVYYSMFGLGLLGVLLLFRNKLKRGGYVTRAGISHHAIIFLAVIGLIISISSAMDAIEIGLSGEMSFYLAKQQLAGYPAKFLELGNELMTMALFIGVAVLTGSRMPESDFHVTSEYGIRLAYGVLGVIVLLYLTLLGDRSTLFNGFLWLGMYLYHVGGRRMVPRITFILGVCVLLLLPGSALRSVVFNAQAPPVADDSAFSIESIEHVPRKPPTPLAKAGSLILSNEMFAAHFSMYGCTSMDIEPNKGVAFRYFEQRLKGNADAPSTYDYYARSVGADPGQGYSIHHATSWYVNMGILGPLVGGCMLGLFYMLCTIGATLVPGRWSISIPLMYLPISMVSYLPALIRSGPEAYKAMILEGCAIPMLVLGFAVFISALITPKK